MRGEKRRGEERRGREDERSGDKTDLCAGAGAVRAGAGFAAAAGTSGCWGGTGCGHVR